MSPKEMRPMLTALLNACVLTPDEQLAGATVVIRDGCIEAVGVGLAPPAGAQTFDLSGLTLAPGFIDIHVHGGAGFSLITEDPEEIRSYARWVVSRGVTGFLATLVGAPLPQMKRWLATAAAADEDVDGGARPLGVHLEGPFVNPARRGALPAEGLRPPAVAEFLALAEAAQGRLKVITLAPELPGAADLIAAARERGVAVSMGHTDATYEQALEAIEWGVRQATHCFNGMRPFHHRDPGCLGAILSSPMLSAELIADGVHVHPGAMALLLAAKGPQRTILVTDGIAAAGLADGAYALAGEAIQVRDGVASLPDGTLAGSVATMDQAVRNMVRLGLAPLAQAVRMASSNPAAALGLGQRLGRVAPGFAADLVALDESLEVAMTFVGGEPAHD
jgi:N-acetylglucosamine-6-phosphate deacetylase